MPSNGSTRSPKEPPAAYLRTVMTVEAMDRLVGIDGETSKCAHDNPVGLTPIPVLTRPFP